MNKTNISQIDLNLLVVFDAVCELQNTVRAAERLNTSQSAVSHALARLRFQLKDPLFVRSARGVIPTPRALAMQQPVRQIIESARSVFFEGKEFNPLTAVTTFRIATTDYIEQVIFPDLLDYLQVEAPSVTIISRPTHGALPKDDLEKGEYDLAIAGFYQDIPDRYFKQKLFQDDFVCVGNKKLFKDGDELSVAEYAELKHILISPQGDLQSKASELMKKKGAAINYSAGLLSFVSPGRILSKTDLALTCPRKLANSFCEYYPLAIAELPIKIPPIHLTQVWHERFQNDAAHSWLRTTIAKICSKK